MISTSFPENKTDWRGRFIANLTSALAEKKPCTLSLWAPPGELPENVKYVCTPEEAKFLHQLMIEGGIAHLLRTSSLRAMIKGGRISWALYKLYKNSNAELFHVHWLQNALFLSGKAPVIISMLGSDFGLLKWPLMVRMLRISLRKQPCILAPNAFWMAEKLTRLFGDIAEIRPIPFGVDAAWLSVKREPAFNSGSTNWLCVSRLTKNKVGPLFSWGEGIFDSDHQLHVIGPKQESEISIPEWAVYHGPKGPDTLRNQWFPIGHGLITLSIHDEGRPQVILEAMAAGIPVIASNIESHRDIIEHGVNGMLVSDRSELVAAIERLSTASENMRIGEAGKKWIIENIGTWEDCADRYTAAYEELLNHDHNNIITSAAPHA